MTHTRSRQGRVRADQRYQHYYDLLLLKMIEKQRIKDGTYHDYMLSEQVNTIVCHEHPIHQGEVLIDTRLRGYYQRLS